jgi:hypothetical protein
LKPVKKKSGIRGINYFRVGQKMVTFQLFLSVQKTGGSPTIDLAEIRRSSKISS